jgi:NADH dehydrogenase [ubiquinone] 1 alpha subcomplex assembly factor 7
VNALGRRIAALIAAQGPISIAQFMTVALHDPQFGYYATRDPLGKDFTTAPEVSQMFGELIGLWLVQCWMDQGQPSPARLVELGPGKGTLMADALRAAKLAPDFLAAIEVVLIEASPTLRAVQQETLKDTGVSISWRDSFDGSLDDKPLFLIANEFFDALPIRQYVFTERGWCERMVTTDQDGALAFALSPVPAALDIPSARGVTDLGAIYEVAPSATALTDSIAGIIAARGGAALLIDYGYGGAGFGETFQAIGAGTPKNVLETPGTLDLSAHVDFAALAASATANDATTYGPAEQGVFLDKLGLKARAQSLTRKNPGNADAIAAAAARLTAADQMGTLFKALAIMPKDAPTPPGFA